MKEIPSNEASSQLVPWTGLAWTGVVAAVPFLWKLFLKHVVRSVVTRLFRKLTVQECFEKDMAITQHLAELRATSSADRVALCQFQNGEHFHSNLAGWKSTVTHEVHALGIEPTMGVHQQILASRLYDVLKLLFSSTKSNRDFILCKMSEDLPPSFARFSFEARGVKKLVLAPIFKDVHGDDHLCGYIRLEYCGVNAKRCGAEKDCDDCTLRRNILNTARMLEMEIYARARRKN
ncbi:MAG: hypothetical protein FWD53_07730 [Phycisphaerales bacterium]|nr:hypothetical protein [Phycisphaerales bacterium]